MPGSSHVRMMRALSGTTKSNVCNPATLLQLCRRFYQLYHLEFKLRKLRGCSETVSQNDIKYQIAERFRQMHSMQHKARFEVWFLKLDCQESCESCSRPAASLAALEERQTARVFWPLFFDLPAVSSSLGELELPLTEGGFAPSQLLTHFQELCLGGVMQQ